MWLKIQIECTYLWLCRQVLMGRNVARALVVSRRDNNEMWAMAERIESIEKRIRSGYKYE